MRKLAFKETQTAAEKVRIKSLDPFRAKKIFKRKAEDGPYLGFRL